jgi:hypoxanthine phosphoribosyltransferase
MNNKIEVMISEEEIAKRVLELAEVLNTDYKGKSVKLVCVLTGGFIFMADLIKRLDLDVTVDFIDLSSYSGTESSGNVKIMRDLKTSIEGEHVLVVEDIVDTGRSLSRLKSHFASLKPASFKLCTLLDKPSRRDESLKDLSADYIGFVIENEFVVGYGLDFDQKYRNLPFIGKMVVS